jgi:SAM-dependent methyltransferase
MFIIGFVLPIIEQRSKPMTGQKGYVEAVNAHYTPGGLADTILNTLKASGKDMTALTPDDFAMVDHLHSGGKGSTLQLAQLAGLKPGMEVLDVGGGMGGAARTFAGNFGCRVTVLDLTESFVEAGKQFTHLTGLADKVHFELGNALQMPFEDNSFDRVITQHSTMNISDKPRLYSEVYRVLRPGGQFVFHEMLAGPNGPLHFPVPWARQGDISFLIPPEEVHELLTRLGFKELTWKDETAETLEWTKGRFSGPAGPPPTTPQLGLHLLFGPDLKAMFGNIIRNMEEGRLKSYWAAFEK